MHSLLYILLRKLEEFDEELNEGSAVIGRDQAAYLELLANYVTGVTQCVIEKLRAGMSSVNGNREHADQDSRILALAMELHGKTEERARRTWDQRFTWASLDGRQIRWHHVPRLSRALLSKCDPIPIKTTDADWIATWLPSLSDEPHEAATANTSPCVLARVHVTDVVSLIRQVSGFLEEQLQGQIEQARVEHVQDVLVDDECRDTIGAHGTFKQNLARRAAWQSVLRLVGHLALRPASAECDGNPCPLIRVLLQDATDHCLKDGHPNHFLPAKDLGGASSNLRCPELLYLDAFPRTSPQIVFQAAAVSLPFEAGLIKELVGRRALHPELDELDTSKARLNTLLQSLEAKQSGGGGENLVHHFAKACARFLAGRILVLHTHAAFEYGLKAELRLLLLRVWLADLKASIRMAERLLEQSATSYPVESDRPLVDPNSKMLPATLDDYRVSNVAYDSGDFLTQPPDLSRARVVPEMSSGGSRPKELEPSERVPEIQIVVESVVAELSGWLERIDPARLSLEQAIAANLKELCNRSPQSDHAHARIVMLRALVELVVPRWLQEQNPLLPKYSGAEALALEALRRELRKRILDAASLLGADLWQNPSLQPDSFLLADAVAYFKGLESICGRLAWLEQHQDSGEEESSNETIGRCWRAVAWCKAEIEDTLKAFDTAFARLRRGFYAPEIRAGSLILSGADTAGSPLAESKVEAQAMPAHGCRERNADV